MNISTMKTVRSIAARVLPPALRTRLRRLLSRSANPDEIGLVAQVFANQTRGTMIDVGAHHGGAALPFLELGWNVLGFEPDVENRAILQAFGKRYPRLKIDGRALGDRVEEKRAFFRSPLSTGISSLLAFHPTHVSAPAVSVTTLDAALQEYGIAAIDFLKIDVEGYDLFVLQGLNSAIPVRAIMLEFEDRKTRKIGYCASDLADALMARGFTVIASIWNPIVEYGRTHSWREFANYPYPIDGACWGNLIGFSRPQDAEKFRTCAAHWQHKRPTGATG